MDLNDIKQKITSSNWVKIASKYNTPALSIFSDEIKNELNSSEFQLNKIYYFDDDTHSYKIQCLPNNNKKFFVIFAKSRNSSVQVPVKQSKQKINISFNNKLDKNQIMIIIAVAVVLIESILLSGPIMKAFGA